MNKREAVYQIQNSQFQVLYADITSLQSDVIVSSDDNYLSMGGGVSYAILQKAGETLREEVRKHLPIKIGEVAVTTAGNLKAKYIFHGVTIDYDNYFFANEDVISKIVEKCLELAEYLGVKSISFPALGTGVAGFPFQVAAKIMTEKVSKHLSKSGVKLETVRLCLFAREGVKSSDIDLFYEKAVGLMSVLSQNNQLSSLINEAKVLLEKTGRVDLLQDMIKIQDKLQTTNKSIHISLENSSLDTKVVEAEYVSLGNQISEYSEKSIEVYEDRQLESKLLQTKISGLYTTLNIKQQQLNTYQIEEAKYGGIMIPPRLTSAIKDLETEMSKIEENIREIRKQQANLLS